MAIVINSTVHTCVIYFDLWYAPFSTCLLVKILLFYFKFQWHACNYYHHHHHHHSYFVNCCVFKIFMDMYGYICESLNDVELQIIHTLIYLHTSVCKFRGWQNVIQVNERDSKRGIYFVGPITEWLNIDGWQHPPAQFIIYFYHHYYSIVLLCKYCFIQFVQRHFVSHCWIPIDTNHYFSRSSLKW